MAEVFRVKPKGKWKKLETNSLITTGKAFPPYLSAIHELTDYEITLTSKNWKIDNSNTNSSDGCRQKKLKKRIKKTKSTPKTINVSLPTNKITVVDAVSALPQDLEDVSKKSPKRKKKNNGLNLKNKKRKLLTDNISPSAKTTCNKIRESAGSLLYENQQEDCTEMDNWKNLFIPVEVLRSLKEQGFSDPTPVQAFVIPHAIRDRMDIACAAETGSGKTLAFGIPLIHNILKYKHEKGESVSIDDYFEDVSGDTADENNSDDNLIPDVIDCLSKDCGMVENVASPKLDLMNAPMSLVLQPTRELAIQCKKHLQMAAKYSNIKVESIVGGMSLQKQQRVLRRQPEILVATPGRLWELVEQDDPYLRRIDEVHSLVVDEADRMVEKGHFEELTKLLQIINSNLNFKKRRQTFVFSATLTMCRPGPQRSISKKRSKQTTEDKLESLTRCIGMKEKSKVIDLTQKTGTVDTLTEARINCSLEDKDLYLYYFLCRYPGRTLIFSNSKDCIRRLFSILTLLKCKPLSLHADMHQKQRLNNLEKFTENEQSLLLASDVAARGLDIPNVQHVIHYQVPYTVENYVHRSGRTARASKEGLSVVLIGPDDMKNYRKIMHTLNRNEELIPFPVESEYLATLKIRLNLAKQIDTQEYRFKKKKHQNDWFVKAAHDMDIELDDDKLLHDLGDDYQQSCHISKMKQLRSELSFLLQQSVRSRNFSAKYPTQTGKLLVNKSLGDCKDAVTEVKQNQMVKRKRNSSFDKEKTMCKTFYRKQ